MARLYYDTECCGLHGPITLIQYAYDDGDIELYCPWDETIEDTIKLIEEFMNHEVIGFNLAFDHFHLCQMYTTLLLMDDQSKYLDDCMEEYALKEEKGRFGPCLKPEACFDLFLHARKTEYQSTMDREDIRIKRVPTQLAYLVAAELGHRIPLKDVYFARKQDPTTRWQVVDIEDEDLRIDINFKDIVLKFAPSSALKTLAQDALGFDLSEVLLFHDVEVAPEHHPKDLGYAPFCTAIGQPGNWKGAWPEHIKYHINHWLYHTKARQYAADDVKYTRMLYKFFSALAGGLSKEESTSYARGELVEEIPDLPINDDDSVLACMVGAVRWKGFAIDIDGIKQLKEKCELLLTKLDFNFESVAVVRIYLEQVMNQTEKLAIAHSTKAVILEDISKWRKAVVCECGGLDQECSKCRGEGLIELEELHPAAIRAKEILDARHAKKEIELYEKLLTAGRFHASFKVIGTLSSRMSGADGLNPQGIKRDKNVRKCFPLADGGLVLCGGDFAGFEVVLIDAVYADPALRVDLQSGKKIHALFGQYCFPHLSYDQIMASKGAKDAFQDFYSRSKQGVFALAYGGEAYTLSNRVGIPEEAAQRAYEQFTKKYAKVGSERQRYFNMFCVTADTWIQTVEGPRKVRELINKPVTIIVNGQIVKTEGFFESGRKQVFKLETTEGYFIRVSKDHPFLITYMQNRRHGNDGFSLWTQTKDIKIDSKITLAKQLNLEWEGEGTWKEGYLLGWLFGDGTVYKTSSRLYFYYPDYCLIKFVQECFDELPAIQYVSESNCYIIYSKELDLLIEKFGITPFKDINDHIEQASSDFYKGFLSGFFDADGTAKKECKEIDLHQSNSTRLRGVQRMLLRLGICSNILELRSTSGVIQGRKCNVQKPYRLYIGASNVELFANRIGLQHPEKKKNYLTAIAKCSKKKLYKEDYLATVKAITPEDIEIVYDIHVPEVHYFDANGLLAHNCSMRQPKGIGTKVEWHPPAEYIESIFGFRRYFTLENSICQALFQLAEEPPKDWNELKIKVIRRDREQTACGAVRSALFGAAFAVQAGNMRAAGNHVIQSSGAQMTKFLQRRIWDLQPAGIYAWRVQPMNVHDEIMCPTHPSIVADLSKVIATFIEEFKQKVPLLEIEWGNRINSWADK